MVLMVWVDVHELRETNSYKVYSFFRILLYIYLTYVMAMYIYWCIDKMYKMLNKNMYKKQI